MNNRRNLLIMIIAFSLILILGSSYAYLTYTKESTNNYVINVGTLEVTFVDSETQFLNLSDMYPMTDEEGEDLTKELIFQVKNTGNVDSYYDVTIEEVSTIPEFKSVIKYIVNKDNTGYKEPKILVEDKYIEAGGLLKPNGIADYRVKVWLAETADNTYMNKEFKAKVVVNSFQKSDYAKDVIKSKLVKYSESSKDTFAGGLVAVNTNGKLYDETDDSQVIREYRYSGPSVDNYVTFNDEKWRIVGVFKDEFSEEHVKIVRNEVLKKDIIPLNYVINDTTYNVKISDADGTVYWDKRVGQSNHNDWSKAGLQYYLNTKTDTNNEKGYLSYLSLEALDMIKDETYNLGNVTFFNDGYGTVGIKNNAKEAYINERTETICASSGCVGGDIWQGNAYSWYGKVALLYPSDLGYSVSSQYWNVSLMRTSFDAISNNGWLQENANHITHEWMLSPGTYNTTWIAIWDNGKFINANNCTHDKIAVRPTLYLKSNVKIISGDGSKENAYKLSLN